MATLRQDLKTISPYAEKSYLVTTDNLNAVNDALENHGKGRLARVGHYVDFADNVLWSNDSHGYSMSGTTRICSLR